MASSSHTEPMLVHGWTYDVFLSFAGKDTRLGFVGHLYRALDDKGIYTFRDDLQLRMGNSISDKLLRSIEESMFSIVVFSEKYADSSWCLDELVKIMDCHRLRGQTVIPVFYNVDPSDVGRQNGCFEKAFQKHEARYNNELEKVHRWKNALLEAANISGCDVSVTANGNESECIEKIVNEISSKCYRSSSADKNLDGIIPRVREVKSLLNPAADKLIIGIWGMGGAGKTTLAWAVYNEIKHQFQGGSYVANIREVSKISGLHSLQQQVLSDLLFERDLKITSDLQGADLMAKRLSCKKILLVLDDVDDDCQLDALVGSRDWFGKGSRVIITTRDEQCLRRAKVDHIYKSVMLDDAEAIKLFSIFAFGRSSPPEEHKEHSKWIVHYASGLPLALKVLGSLLDGKDMKEWKSTLDRLAVFPEVKVNDILKISYDGLRETEKLIFLDIACFFKGKRINFATKILDSFGFFADIGIRVLIQKSLVSVLKGRLCMHDRIQEMGWQIVRNVSRKPGENSRLWLDKDVCHVLTSGTGTNAVEGIYLDLADQRKDLCFSADTFKNMLELRFLYLNYKYNYRQPYESKRISIETGNNNLSLPSKLQWLTWNGYNLGSLPESFKGEELVGLEMHCSNIIQLWNGSKNLDKLTYIDLSHSWKLRSTPDLKGIPNLKSLTLVWCPNLVEVHPSLVDHKKIVNLNLSYCGSLESLPSPIHMESLETLILTACTGLSKFTEISERTGTLFKLYLGRTNIVKLPESIKNLTGLILKNLKKCEGLRSLPDTIGRLKCLRTIDVSDCPSLGKLPKSLTQVQSLETLILSNKAQVQSLKELFFAGIGTTITEPPYSIESLKNLKTLSLGGCKLSEGEFPGDVRSLVSLEKLDLSYNPFKYLPDGISQLPRLKIIDVSNCYNLEKLDRLPSGIAVLEARECPKLTSFLDFTKYDSLWKINMSTDEGGWEESADSVLESLLEGHLVANDRLSILFPRNGNIPGRLNKIPEWFSEHNHGHLQLPSGWCSGNILGFALSAHLDEYFYGDNLTIQFDMIPGHMQPLKLTPSQVDNDLMKRQVWLGFLSFDSFKLLFPQFNEEDWSQFEGSLSIRSSRHHPLAIRLVSKFDLMATIKNSAAGGVLDNSIGRPLFKYYDSNDDDEIDPYGLAETALCPESFSLYTAAYWKQLGTLGAKLTFKL